MVIRYAYMCQVTRCILNTGILKENETAVPEHGKKNKRDARPPKDQKVTIPQQTIGIYVQKVELKNVIVKLILAIYSVVEYSSKAL